MVYQTFQQADIINYRIWRSRAKIISPVVEAAKIPVFQFEFPWKFWFSEKKYFLKYHKSA